MFHKVLNQFRSVLSLCYLCQLPSDNRQIICLRCQSYFEANSLACRRCAMPMPVATDALCGQCQQVEGYIDETHAPWRFRQPLTRLIHDFKYHSGLYLAPFLSQCVLKALPRPLPDIDYLIPMPIHQKRLRFRGYNQASLLGKQISKQTGIPLNQTLCHRINFQTPQALLDQKSRLKNTKNAFAATTVKDRHLVMIDDLITTGATANSLAKELKKQGAKRVDLWCIARQY